MDWEPSNDLLRTDTHRQEEVHHIRVMTQKTKTVCHFEEGDTLLVDPSSSRRLKPVIQGQRNLVERTRWLCEIQGSNSGCPDYD